MAKETEDAVRQALALGASDLHLSAGLPPMARVHGVLRSLDPEAPAWSDAQVRQVLQQLMTPARWTAFQDQLEDDFAFTHTDWGRWRVNAFQQHRGAALVLRFIPAAVPRLAELNAPALLSDLALQAHGLILVTGPTGCGKSTLLAAQAMRHQQREVGLHTHSFEAALRSALREDPDVILIGELRDLATIRLALTAAETGHLVLASLHTASAPQAIDRMVDVFPAEEKDMVRTLLADALLAVVAQTLCPRPDGTGRVAAHEVMVATPAVRNLIREGKGAQLYSALQTGAQAGMQTLDQSLQALRQRGQISAETARGLARFPATFSP